ncbi:MAG TPA: hypothetical protein VEU53_03980, partial [Stellaceae bacterium]|nr:hypothetical protein [Stellaceae bacterium]
MRLSEDRILVTHTGSLPRPAALTALYARRERGEAVDGAELAAAGREALRAIVAKQAHAGIDVGNNGEQQREGFFLHMRRRLSGLGGSWKRWPRGDIERYPLFKQAFEDAMSRKTAVGNFAPPKVVGEMRYLGSGLIRQECQEFRAVLDELGAGFVEPFLTAPSPGMIASAMRNEY